MRDDERAELQELRARVAVLELTLRVIRDEAKAAWKPMQARHALEAVGEVAAVMLRAGEA